MVSLICRRSILSVRRLVLGGIERYVGRFRTPSAIEEEYETEEGEEDGNADCETYYTRCAYLVAIFRRRDVAVVVVCGRRGTRAC